MNSEVSGPQNPGLPGFSGLSSSDRMCPVAPVLPSHGRGHWVETSIAHQTFPLGQGLGMARIVLLVSPLQPRIGRTLA
jgi:hypothetical protein